MIEMLPYSTPQERRVIYQQVREAYENEKERSLWGMCSEIRTLIGLKVDHRRSLDPVSGLKGFPELAAQKPRTTYSIAYWYPLNSMGVERRISDLTKAIELCNKQTN